MESILFLFLIVLAIWFLVLAFRIVWFLLPFILIVLIILSILRRFDKGERKSRTYETNRDDDIVDVEFKVRDHDED